MTSSTPRFGIIGSGVWARMIYAPVARSSPDVTFTSIFGRNADATAAIAAEFGAMAYADLDAFLDSVDVIGICVSPNAQARFALAAAAAGKHMILEKPLSMDPGESRAIADAVEARGLRSAVFFTRMFQPGISAWIREMQARTWFYARSQGFGRILVDPANPFNATQWRHEVGALWDSAPHAVATLQAVLGDIAEVSATAGPNDLAHLTLRHRAGAISTISVSFAAPAVFPGELVLFGESGAQSQPPVVDFVRDTSEAFGIAVRAIAAPEHGTLDPLPDARFGAKVTAVIAAAARSIATGERVTLG